MDQYWNATLSTSGSFSKKNTEDVIQNHPNRTSASFSAFLFQNVSSLLLPVSTPPSSAPPCHARSRLAPALRKDWFVTAEKGLLRHVCFNLQKMFGKVVHVPKQVMCRDLWCWSPSGLFRVRTSPAMKWSLEMWKWGPWDKPIQQTKHYIPLVNTTCCLWKNRQALRAKAATVTKSPTRNLLTHFARPVSK